MGGSIHRAEGHWVNEKGKVDVVYADEIEDVANELKKRGATGLYSINLRNFNTRVYFAFDNALELMEFVTHTAAIAIAKAGMRDVFVQLHLQNELGKTHLQIQARPKDAERAAKVARDAIEAWIKELTGVSVERRTERETVRGVGEFLSEKDINIVMEALRIADKVIGEKVEASDEVIAKAEAIDVDALIANAEAVLSSVRKRVRTR